MKRRAPFCILLIPLGRIHTATYFGAPAQQSLHSESPFQWMALVPISEDSNYFATLCGRNTITMPCDV